MVKGQGYVPEHSHWTVLRNVAFALDHHQLDLLSPVHWCVPTPLHCCCVLKVTRASQRSFSSINVFGTLFLLSFLITYRGLLVDTSTTSCQPSSELGSTTPSLPTSSTFLSTLLKVVAKITAGSRLALEPKGKVSYSSW